MSIRAAGLWYIYIPTVETASDAAATVMSAETEFPRHRSNAMNGKTAFVLGSGVLSGSLCACVKPPIAAAPAAPTPPPVAAPAPAPAPRSRGACRQPLGQYPGGDMPKSCWRYHRTIRPRHRCSISAIRQRASVAEPSTWPRSPTLRSGRTATARSILTDRPSRRLGRLIDKPSDDRARHFSGVDHWTLGGERDWCCDHRASCH